MTASEATAHYIGTQLKGKKGILCKKKKKEKKEKKKKTFMS